MDIRLGISPCPNDTFIFDALVNRKIDTGDLNFLVEHHDVETLNQRAIHAAFDITKLSFAAWSKLVQSYTLLESGAALGRGVGPLLVQPAISGQTDVASCSVAIPGEMTTAHFLFEQFYPKHPAKVFMPFDKIESWVLAQQPKEQRAGVLIHENRFTYMDRGLILIEDLGTSWEQKTGLPIPLGCIAIKREFTPEVQQEVNRLIRESLAYSWANYPKLSEYVTSHAQEMSEDVMRKHIELYVNEYTEKLDDEAFKAIELMQEMWNSGE